MLYRLAPIYWAIVFTAICSSLHAVDWRAQKDNPCWLALDWAGRHGWYVDSPRLQRFVRDGRTTEAAFILTSYGQYNEAAMLWLHEGNLQGAIEVLSQKLVAQIEPLLVEGHWKLSYRDYNTYRRLTRPEIDSNIQRHLRDTLVPRADNFRKIDHRLLSEDYRTVLQAIDEALTHEASALDIVRQLVMLHHTHNVMQLFNRDELALILYYGANRDQFQNVGSIVYFTDAKELELLEPKAHETYVALQHLQVMQAFGLMPEVRDVEPAELTSRLARELPFHNPFKPGTAIAQRHTVLKRNNEHGYLYTTLRAPSSGKTEKAYILIPPSELYGLLPFILHAADVTDATSIKFSVDPYEMEKHDYFVGYFTSKASRRAFARMLETVLKKHISPTLAPPLSYPVSTFVAGGTDLPGDNHRARVAYALVDAFRACRDKDSVSLEDIEPTFKNHRLNPVDFTTPR